MFFLFSTVCYCDVSVQTSLAFMFWLAHKTCSISTIIMSKQSSTWPQQTTLNRDIIRSLLTQTSAETPSNTLRLIRDLWSVLLLDTLQCVWRLQSRTTRVTNASHTPSAVTVKIHGSFTVNFDPEARQRASSRECHTHIRRHELTTHTQSDNETSLECHLNAINSHLH